MTQRSLSANAPYSGKGRIRQIAASLRSRNTRERRVRLPGRSSPCPWNGPLDNLSTPSLTMPMASGGVCLWPSFCLFGVAVHDCESRDIFTDPERVRREGDAPPGWRRRFSSSMSREPLDILGIRNAGENVK